MVVDFFYPVAPGLLIPAVEGKLPEGVGAALADHQPPPPQQFGGGSDTGQHVVVGLFHPPSPPAQGLDKAGRRRVGHHLPDGPSPRQPLQGVGVLSVGSLPPLGPGVIVGLRHPVPHSVPQPPQPQGRGVDRTVIAGDAPPLHAAHRDGPRPALVEEIVYPPLGGHPLPQHKPPVEGAAEAARVPLPHLRRQRRVILHGEVEVERPPLLRL